MNIFDKIFDENNSENITLFNENGEPVDFEQVALIPYNEENFIILKPVELLDGMSENEALVFRLIFDYETEEEILRIVTEDDVIDAVFDIYDRIWEQSNSGTDD